MLMRMSAEARLGLADHFAQIDVSVNVHVAVSPGLEADAGGVEKGVPPR